ncbi:MAG TPA: Flp pilus assembly protein CpaB [Oligoflexia bacterium]|nr:Flp pilus assembly protein CpaB [Oligoflexia bacterium]HMP27482.1 Flp pilus assembly protein CpaB [Oligoflexia bacterium]
MALPRRFGGGSGRPLGADRARLFLLAGLSLLVIAGFIGVALLATAKKNKNNLNNQAVVYQEAQIELVPVLVPVRKIEQGTPFEPGMFRRENRPKISLTTGIVRDFEQIKGQYARALIIADQPLHQDFVTPVRPISNITSSIPDGYRAVTIRVDAKSAVEGWAVPGARVDVVWATRVGDEQGLSVIVENAKILSAERSSEAAPVGVLGAVATVPSTVTLLVTAEEANKIQLASLTGTLSLSLRGASDTGKGSGGSVISVKDLLDKKQPNLEQKKNNKCSAKVRTCKGKVCEELCLTADGELVPRSQAEE